MAAGSSCQSSFFCVRSHLTPCKIHAVRDHLLLNSSEKLTFTNTVSIFIATRTTTASYLRYIKSGKESMAPPRGPRGGEKPKGQRQNRDANRGRDDRRDDRRDEQSRAASRQDGQSGDRGRGGQGVGDGRGNPDFPSSGIPKGPVGLLSRMMGKAVNKVKPGHRVPDPVNLKSNKKSSGGRDPPTRAEKPNRNRRRNPSPKPVSPATVPSAIASRVTSLESTRPQLRHRELPKKPQESSARLHRFDSASQNAPPSSKDSTKTTLAKPATWNTTWTKTARPTIAPAIATTQITTPEIICQPRTPVDDVENPFTVPANELSRIISDLRSRIKSRPANQTKPSKVSRLLKETAGPSLNLSLPEGGRIENAEPENHKPSTVGMLENNVSPIVDKLQQEVANRAEQESHASINLNSVAKSNALPYPPPSAGNPGAVGTLLAKPQRPSPSTPTEPRGPVSRNKSAPQAPEPVPKLAPLVLEPWRRDPASLDMTIYRKKMADLYQKVCATSCLNTAMSIH